MGSRMAANLVSKGFDVTVWNRTASVASDFAATRPGVRVAGSPREAGEGAELVITMVVDGPQVTELLLGPEGAALDAAPGTVFADCSTIGPAAAVELSQELSSRGFVFLDTPVTGSSPRAEDGTLVFMAGGPADAFERVKPVLEAMGTTIVYAGKAGQGQAVKVINNAMAAANAVIVGQALLAAKRQGIDLDALVTVASGGSGASTMLTMKAEPMRTHNYATLFKLDHMLKDVRFCIEALSTAGGSEAEFDIARETEAVLSEASSLGFGDQDFASLIEALEKRYGQRL